MFNELYGLNQAVLDLIKTNTRRIITCPKSFKGQEVCGFYVYRRMSDNAVFGYPIMYDADGFDIEGAYILPKYKVGEVVAIAQSYKEAGINPKAVIGLPIKGSKTKGVLQCEAQHTPGWTNKMFVRADLMPHHIRITNVRMERLNDISESDCRAEGIDYVNGYSESYFFGFGVKTDKGWIKLGNTPREAYAALIDKISGKGTWDSNPYVFVYDFELVD